MDNKQRLIDANLMREDWLENGENEYIYDTNAVLASIDEQPTVDAVEVVHGRWIDVALRFTQVKEKCSVCGGIVYAHGFSYCPNCGAKMDGDKND